MRETKFMWKQSRINPTCAGKERLSFPETAVSLENGQALFRAGVSATLLALALALAMALICAVLIGATGAHAQSVPQSIAQEPEPQNSTVQTLAPREAEAQRFLMQRGVLPGSRFPRNLAGARAAAGPGAAAGLRSASSLARPKTQSSGSSNASATWQPLGPTAVQTSSFGLVTGRISSIAFDPSDATGNHVYIGTTGGGVWAAQNGDSSTLSQVVFSPLTDVLPAFGGATDPSISIGALTVQPGGTGVVLAGTGDPNDELDSYYGAGILRSTDSGSTWSLIPATRDEEDGLSGQDYSFTGEGFAGFAWSTTNPQLVVAAVSQAYEGTLVDAETPNASYDGLYYSPDSGATWHLATITDGSGGIVQGPLSAFVSPHGNAATAVVWNPVRNLFVAAVRYHGYYQSSDGITWTRMTAQPFPGLTTFLCPTNIGATGSIACPIFRGALAVNPQTGDTFAWTVDANNQDQGLWQDSCLLSGSSCTNTSITFARQSNNTGGQWNTAKLETSTTLGAVTIADGNYNLALAAVPSQQDTLVFAGANDLWKCSIAMGCVWRNTTNSTSSMSAQVGEFQHAIAWNPANELEMFIGNDSGLWRSTDAVGETGTPGNSSDASHFQNMNGTLGSLAEVESLSPVPTSPYTLMAGLGVNGTAGIKGSSLPSPDNWPQILGGYGGPVAIDPSNNSNWYINDQSGVYIYRCTQATPCAPADFGTTPVVTDADVGGDGYAMPTPAPFLVDPVDPTQLLIGTCRVWRGPANGSGWTSSDAISSILDSGATGVSCNGDALIRSMAALALPGGNEIIYVGMYGSAYNGSNLPGRVLSATFNPTSGASPVWNDITLNANTVTNDTDPFNKYGFDISSVVIDPSDPTGQTVYATVEGVQNPLEDVREIYMSTNGGATWTDITANLPASPANSLAIDPKSPNTVYVATDQGAYFTTGVQNCGTSLSNCWSAFGTGLPLAPVVALSAQPATASQPALVAGTYGRGIWQTPLCSTQVESTAAAATPGTLTFPSQIFETPSSPQTVTLQNTGGLPLTSISISVTGDFSETDDCQAVSATAPVGVGGSCAINVTFSPSATGPLTGQMTITANVCGGQFVVDLNGTGAPGGVVALNPGALNLQNATVGSASSTFYVSVANNGSAAIPITSPITVTPPFAIVSNTCGTTSLAANFTCQIGVNFTPTKSGAVAGTLNMTDGAGIQTVELSGTDQSAPTDILNPTSLTFTATTDGQVSAALPVTITNMGDLPLTNIIVTASAQFQSTSNFVTQIAAHSVGTISVQFAPTQVGAVSGSLTIADALTTQTVALNGTGLQPGVITPNPAILTFPTGQPRIAEAPQSIIISNTGGASIANIGFQITGAAAASFSVGTTTCGVQLNIGSSCTVQVNYTPPASGSISASLAISSSTNGVKAVSVPLNPLPSTGLAASPTLETFAVATGVGQSSSAQIVTVTNAGTGTLASLTPTATGPFSITQNTCTGALAAQATCTIGVVFQPTVFGPATGTLSVSSSSVSAPAAVALAGAGFDFMLGTPSPSSQTVTNGQQADFTVPITAEGAPGTFTFQCGTLPSNALCLFNPTTATATPGVTGTGVMVQIYTGGSSVVGRAEPSQNWRALPMLCGLFLLPMALWRRRKALLLAVLAAVLAGGISSCTSSSIGKSAASSSQSGSSATPAGTYTIPVIVTAAGVSYSRSVTLTVD